MMKSNKYIILLAGLIPILYILSISVFFLWIKVSQGHFPTYGNPDPKSYPILHLIDVVLMMMLPISFLIWAGIILKSLIDSSWKSIHKYAPLGFVGFSLIVGLIIFDPMEILQWLAD